jgi:hypothetical protein
LCVCLYIYINMCVCVCVCVCVIFAFPQVQFDPPRDPDFFVHRVGRTARAGREGRALIFLLPEEDAYIHLLQGNKARARVTPATCLLGLRVRGVVSGHSDCWCVLRDLPRARARAHVRVCSAQVPITEHAPFKPVEGLDTSFELRALAQADRDVLEKGTEAFVAFLRGCVCARAPRVGSICSLFLMMLLGVFVRACVPVR